MLRRSLILLCCLPVFANAFSQSAPVALNGNVTYPIPDTVNAISVYHEVTVHPSAEKSNGMYTALAFSRGSILFTKDGRKRSVVFELKDTADTPAFTSVGLGAVVDGNGSSVAWPYQWQTGVTYKTLVTALPDTATHTTIYAAYLFLPEKQEWKMLGAAATQMDGGYLRGVYAYRYNTGSRKAMASDSLRFSNAWLQRSNGSWQELQSQRPVVDLARNTDSLAQSQKDRADIFAAVNAKKIDTSGSREGVYYHILKEGTGAQVQVTDTLEVFYKGYLLSDGSVFDQTTDKPARFPLKRLIKGWQVALPMSRVGGTVRVIIPSGMAYGIRARSKNIPPNSILVFDVEIVSAKHGS